MVGTYLNQKNAEIEDLIPPDIVERAIAPYLQNEEMISFCIAEGEPYVNQIESFANDYGITLPDGWKVEIAKKIKIILSKTPKEKIDDKYINIWSRLFDDLS